MKFIPLNIPENIIQAVSDNHSGDVDFMNILNITHGKDDITVSYGYNDIVDETSYRRYHISLNINRIDKTIKAILNCEQIEKTNTVII